MEEIYVNVECDKSAQSGPSTDQTGPRSSDIRSYRAAVLCLGLLSLFLLTGLIGLVIHFHNLERDAPAEHNLTERLQEKLSSLTEDRDQLNDKVSSLTDERDQLQGRLNETTEELNGLQSLSRQRWSMFCCSCYFLSSKAGSWDEGRQDCKDRDADLVVIDNDEEQTFLSDLTEAQTWIGLTDSEVEGTWKWIDGSSLTLRNWNDGEPNNKAAETGEDCAQMEHDKVHKWNDLHCDKPLRWICEKSA
ncbi:hypothetical protein Q5P01_013920 [Channa striata]|uniref:C-type lectin domain-containing protein n=1 Tax=Channa striata TaxID=64152 RepID=A0AA88SNY9_CHASR|nr:hypothetical protein Q5P01_013920 [Channa striata]